MNDYYEQNNENEKEKYWAPKEHSNGEEVSFVDLLKGTYYFLKKANKRAIADLYELMYGVKLRSKDYNKTFYVSKVLNKDFTNWAKKSSRPCGATYVYNSYLTKSKVRTRKNVEREE